MTADLHGVDVNLPLSVKKYDDCLTAGSFFWNRVFIR